MRRAGPRRVPGKLPGAPGDGTPITPTRARSHQLGIRPRSALKTGLFYVPAGKTQSRARSRTAKSRAKQHAHRWAGHGLAPN